MCAPHVIAATKWERVCVYVIMCLYLLVNIVNLYVLFWLIVCFASFLFLHRCYVDFVHRFVCGMWGCGLCNKQAKKKKSLFLTIIYVEQSTQQASVYGQLAFDVSVSDKKRSCSVKGSSGGGGSKSRTAWKYAHRRCEILFNIHVKQKHKSNESEKKERETQKNRTRAKD